MSTSSAGLLESFKKHQEILEGIYKELEDYLEIKRMAFPRFYFLSNNELLEALAQTKTTESVQQHVAKFWMHHIWQDHFDREGEHSAFLSRACIASIKWIKRA